MMSFARLSKCTVMALTAIPILLSTVPAAVRAASVELWPAERRANNTLYSYGADWNALLIVLYANDHGKHKIELPERFTEPTVLTVTLPAAVTFLGAHVYGRPEGVVTEFAAKELTQDGRAYVCFSIPLVNDVLTQRLRRHYYRTHVWYQPPAILDDTISWELHYGVKRLAGGASRLVTAGVVANDAELPKRFGFYPYGSFSIVPGNDHDRMARFYRRFGISGIECHWTAGLPAEDGPSRHHGMLEANRHHGIKNIANMTLFAGKHGAVYGGAREATMKRGGLVAAMDGSCAGLESEAALADWRAAHGLFDMAMWDWEPTGPRMWPGHEDQATVAAFAAKQRMVEELTPELLRTTHREAYATFRMEQIARPLYAMRATINAVKPIPFRVEQGSGASRQIDYDVYGHDFEALTPMIYQPSPRGYARNLMDMLASTTVPAKKFWPDMTIGWSSTNPHRETAQAFLLDTIVTAAAGCGSVSHWPGIHLADASWFGIHDGLTRIALVEDFYFDGSRVDTVAVQGLPYRQETIELGRGRTLVQASPDWRTSLVTFAHELRNETLLTLLNYHPGEEAFVGIKAPGTKAGYMVNPVDRTYHVLDNAGSAIVHVGKESAALWIATSDEARTEGLRPVEADAVRAAFDAARKGYLEANKQGEIALGTVGEIMIGYAEVAFGGDARVCLRVQTPQQTLWLGAGGGRIYEWAVEGMAEFVAKKNFGTDGFGMDMLWLPEAARWSGDETQEMTLVACANDGTEARIVYEGRLDKGLPGINLRKTYRVPAGEASVRIEIALHNERVDQTPVTLAYWAHNVLAVEQMHFVGADTVHETGRGVTTIFTAADLPAELRPHVLMPNRIVGTTGNAYAEFFPEQDAGLVFRLPKNFMNVYRWNSRYDPVCGSEWMSQPISLPAGTSKTLRFSISAMPDATPESLRAALPAESPTDVGTEKVLPHGFAELDDRGLPANWRIRTTGDNAAAATVTAAADETGEMVVRVRLPQEASVHVDTARPIRLAPDDDYMLLVQIKVEDMHYTGNWYGRPAGIRVYVYGTEDKHTWLAVHGDGGTNGWVTAVLPFPANDEVRPYFAASRVFLRCYNMTGTIAFRNPMIMKRPAGLEIQRSFELEDGTRIGNAALQLRR